MKKISIYLGAIITVIFGSCSSPQYWSNYEADKNYNSYSTYQLEAHEDKFMVGVDHISELRIRNAIELELRGMGLRPSDSPDLLVKYLVKNETKFFTEFCSAYYEDVEGGDICFDRVITYEEGSMVIDFVDLSKSVVIWHGGSVGKGWEEMRNPDKEIRKMVGLLLSEFEKLIEEKGKLATI